MNRTFSFSSFPSSDPPSVPALRNSTLAWKGPRRAAFSALTGVFAASVSAALALSSGGCGSKDSFARVNGQVITKDEYIKALERQSVQVPGGAQPISAGRLVIDQLIGNKITLTEAAKANALPTDEEVNHYYDLQKQLFQNQVIGKTYEETLKEQGTTPEEVKINLKAELAESNLYAKQLKLDESEVRQAYDKAQGQIGLPARVQLRLILTAPNSPDFAKAKQMLDAKTPFETVAREVNAVPQLKTTGGLMPQTTPINTIAPSFQAKVQQSAEGTVIGPVDFSLAANQPPAKAWVKIEKKLPAFTIPFEDAAILVRKQLVQQKLLQPQNASVRNAIMNEKINAKFEPTDARYTTIWDSIRKSAQDAGVGKAPVAPAGGASAPGATSPLGTMPAGAGAPAPAASAASSSGVKTK